MTSETTSLQNPLLGPLHQPPAFDRVETEHVEPGIRKLLEELKAGQASLEESATPTWEGLIEPLERLTEPLSQAWGVVSHLMGVRNSDELRAAHAAVQPEVVQAFTDLSQSKRLFELTKVLQNSDAYAAMAPAQKRILDQAVQGYELSGVALEGDEKTRFNEIQARSAELSTAFSNHVLDATKAVPLKLTSKDEVAGLPESTLQAAAQAATQNGEDGATAEDGPWHIPLDPTISMAFLQYADRSDLREKVYRAWVSRASEGDLDNSALIDEILALRQEKSELLGFANYAELSLARKMADSPDAVHKLLDRLCEVALPAARKEHDELVAFAAEQGQTDLAHWDFGYWAEKLRQDRYAFTEEELRPYFPLPRVLDGLFALCERLFGARVEAADGDAPVWNKDARFFRILDAESSAPIAAFYLDPYSRPADKRGGAWMDECLGRSKLFTAPGENVRLPIAYLVCNGTAPVGDRPSLMTFREVETLFHEFGHGLQHMLTRIEHDSAAGISGVEWDAVELPSQFMENWCLHGPTLLGMAKHWETGETLPLELFEKIKAAKTFRQGSATCRQLYFARTDMALHADYDPSKDGTPFDVMRAVAAKTTVIPPLPEDRFLNSFSHIFGGGYAAGYYSYKWAEVLSADAFAAFEENGLEDDAAVQSTGRQFRDTVLALGGSEHPMEVFRQFRGREPSPDALLRHAGLLAS
ncbi:MAG: M3 family metallopeptidase [Planctomycetota bacterium]